MTATQFLELFVSLSLQAAAVVIVAHWLGQWTKNEQLHCRMWNLCYLVLLSLVGTALLLPHLRLFHPWIAGDSDRAAAVVSIGMRLGRTVCWVWLAGSGVSLGMFAIGWIQTFRFLKTCRPVEVSAFSIEALLSSDACAAQSRWIRKTRILTSARVAGPFCWQLQRPYIVLPEYFIGMNLRELRFVVRHELAHLRNGHPLQLFLQRVVEIIFWFHPMVWWASQQSAVVREFACDDAAIDSPEEVGAYLRSMLTIVEGGMSGTRRASGPLAFGSGKSMIAKRARRLVRIAHDDMPQTSFKVPEPALSIALVAIGVVAASIWLPADVLASPRAHWSPWPAWSAAVLHDFGVSKRDFESYYGPSEPSELQPRDLSADVNVERR